jgi:hypothetical protein
VPCFKPHIRAEVVIQWRFYVPRYGHDLWIYFETVIPDREMRETQTCQKLVLDSSFLRLVRMFACSFSSLFTIPLCTYSLRDLSSPYQLSRLRRLFLIMYILITTVLSILLAVGVSAHPPVSNPYQTPSREVEQDDIYAFRPLQKPLHTTVLMAGPIPTAKRVELK